MTGTQSNDIKEQLKARLFAVISEHLDAIDYGPGDIAKLASERASADAASSPPHEDVTAGQDLAQRVNAYYDSIFYSRDGIASVLLGDTDFRNIGYWGPDTKNQQEAAERLQDALLAYIPEKTGRILDVACGLGASTRRLLEHYPAENVWAINISERQIETTKRNAPGCHAMVMNAVDMTFEDDFFDDILCIEAAFHFETRRKFFEQARRVLKSGGRLVLSDVLFTSPERFEQYPTLPGPENHLASVEDYRVLLKETGFRDIVIEDVSKEVWGRHFLHFVGKSHEMFLDGKINLVELTGILWTYYQLNAVTGPCLFISARK